MKMSQMLNEKNINSKKNKQRATYIIPPTKGTICLHTDVAASIFFNP